MLGKYMHVLPTTVRLNVPKGECPNFDKTRG